MFKPSEPY